MATLISAPIAAPIDNGIVVALEEPDVSINVWTVTIKAKVGPTYMRVGSKFQTIAPSVGGQGGNRVLATCMLDGVSEWLIEAETPANGQPGTLRLTAGPQPVTIPPAVVIIEGTPIPVPPPATGEGALNVAWVATGPNGGNNASAQIGRMDRPFSTINAAIAAVLAQSVDRRPGVVRVAGGTYIEAVSCPAGPAANGLAFVADGEVIIDATSLPDPAFSLVAGSVADATAVETFSLGGQSWRLVKGGGIALSIAGAADPNGYFHMGLFTKGGLQLENAVIEGAINLQWLGLLSLHNVVQPEPNTNAIENVSGLRLTGGSTLQNIDLSSDPTADIDSQPQPTPPLGLVVGAGCQVGDVDATGAPRVLVEKGGAMRAFNGAAWAEFFSAAPPVYDAAPALVCYGKAVGNHNWVIPAESAGAVHTEISYRGVDYDGEMTGAKLAGVSRVFCDLLGGVFSGPLDFSGLVTIALRGSTYSEGLLTSAAGAEIDQSAFSIDTNTAVGVLPVAFSNPLPAGVGTDYTVSIEPDATGFSAADVFVSNKTPAGFDLNATGVLPVRLRIERNP